MSTDKISLLGLGERGETSPDILADLALTPILRQIAPETPDYTVFSQTLTHPPLSCREIRNRQQTLAVFAAHPPLLSELDECFGRFSQLRNQWDSERVRLFSSRKKKPDDKSAAFYQARQSLQLDARYLKLTILSLQGIYMLLSRYRFDAEALTELREACAAAAVSPGSRRLYAFADKCESDILEAVSYEVEGETDDELRLSSVLLRDFCCAPSQTNRRRETSLRAFFRRSEAKPSNSTLPPDEAPSAYVTDLSAGTLYELLIDAVSEADRRLVSAARSLFSRFGGIARELSFFGTALRYCRLFSEKGIPLLYPDLLPEEDRTLCITGLRDPVLLLESSGTDSVVANDIALHAADGVSGMLIRGPNSSGKTVFLRSAASAVLLSLAGLPIPADTAAVSIRRGIFTLFASQEEASGGAGRFEQEAAALSATVERITASSLLFLNEIFQSTSYSEGAVGIAPVLRHISLLGGSFLFVTHLTELFSLYRGTPGVILAESADAPGRRFRITAEKSAFSDCNNGNTPIKE